MLVLPTWRSERDTANAGSPNITVQTTIRYLFSHQDMDLYSIPSSFCHSLALICDLSLSNIAQNT